MMLTHALASWMEPVLLSIRLHRRRWALRGGGSRQRTQLLF